MPNFGAKIKVIANGSICSRCRPECCSHCVAIPQGAAFVDCHTSYITHHTSHITHHISHCSLIVALYACCLVVSYRFLSNIFHHTLHIFRTSHITHLHITSHTPHTFTLSHIHTSHITHTHITHHDLSFIA